MACVSTVRWLVASPLILICSWWQSGVKISDFLLLPSNHLEIFPSWESFAVRIAAPSRRSGQEEKGQRLLPPTLVNMGGAACDCTTFYFSYCLQHLGIRNSSLCCALGIEQSWLWSSCRLLHSLNSTDQGLIFISCKNKRDKEMTEAHFFPSVPG